MESNVQKQCIKKVFKTLHTLSSLAGKTIVFSWELTIFNHYWLYLFIYMFQSFYKLSGIVQLTGMRNWLILCHSLILTPHLKQALISPGNGGIRPEYMAI